MIPIHCCQLFKSGFSSINWNFILVVSKFCWNSNPDTQFVVLSTKAWAEHIFEMKYNFSQWLDDFEYRKKSARYGLGLIKQMLDFNIRVIGFFWQYVISSCSQEKDEKYLPALFLSFFQWSFFMKKYKMSVGVLFCLWGAKGANFYRKIERMYYIWQTACRVLRNHDIALR